MFFIQLTTTSFEMYLVRDEWMYDGAGLVIGEDAKLLLVVVVRR